MVHVPSGQVVTSKLFDAHTQEPSNEWQKSAAHHE